MTTVPVQAQIDIVNRVRVSITDLLKAINDLKELRSRWDYLGLGTAFDANNLTGTPHEGVTKQQLVDAYAAITAITTLLDANGAVHGSNLYELLWPIR